MNTSHVQRYFLHREFRNFTSAPVDFYPPNAPLPPVLRISLHPVISLACRALRGLSKSS